MKRLGKYSSEAQKRELKGHNCDSFHHSPYDRSPKEGIESNYFIWIIYAFNHGSPKEGIESATTSFQIQIKLVGSPKEGIERWSF